MNAKLPQHLTGPSGPAHLFKPTESLAAARASLLQVRRGNKQPKTPTTATATAAAADSGCSMVAAAAWGDTGVTDVTESDRNDAEALAMESGS
jgi:hypothetical protein